MPRALEFFVTLLQERLDSLCARLIIRNIRIIKFRRKYSATGPVCIDGIIVVPLQIPIISSCYESERPNETQ